MVHNRPIIRKVYQRPWEQCKRGAQQKRGRREEKGRFPRGDEPTVLFLLFFFPCTRETRDVALLAYAPLYGGKLEGGMGAVGCKG